MLTADQVYIDARASDVAALLAAPRPSWIKPFLVLAHEAGEAALDLRLGRRPSAPTALAHSVRLTLRPAVPSAETRVRITWGVEPERLFSRIAGDLIVREHAAGSILALECTVTSRAFEIPSHRDASEAVTRSLLLNLRNAIES